MTDILFINVPQISLIYPPAATSLLKGVCETNGFTAQVRDFNLQLYTQCSNDNIKQELDQYFSLNNHSATLTLLTRNYLEKFYDQVIDEILSINPKWLGISIFTFQCQIFTKQLLMHLRPRFFNKILVGGAGLSTNGIAADQNDFGIFLQNEKLIDYYIRGEADKNIISLLNDDDQHPGINNDHIEQISDLDDISYPNYDDVIKLNYKYSTDLPQIPITGSRGCVRKCTFCDIHVAWPKYRYRSGKSIAKELISHYKKYNVTNFWFTDSLINGSMKSFRELCRFILDYYQENNLPDKFFKWGGQFIVRDSRSMTADDYDLAARAGMNGVAMGIESLSESVRNHMQKGFSDVDLDFTLEQIHRTNMNCYFLMIVGYPTETEQDFEQGIQKFIEYKKYALDGTIYGVNLGTTASIDEGTPLYNQSANLGIHAPNGQTGLGFNWIVDSNPTLTFRERIRRRIVLQETLMELRYKIWNGDSQLLKLKEVYENIKYKKYKTKIKLHVAE